MSEREVICEKIGACGHIHLNRPKALNALTLTMVRGIDAALDLWEDDPDITRIVVTGEGEKAFSAGGDIRLLYDLGLAGNHAEQLDFWREEYRLNVRIKRFEKPYISLIDGIVMGGGVGVSIHGSHRIAGDKYIFAMPETGIGFFPDVGATYFLSRLPGKTGTYMALTGERANVGDGVALGLATHYVPSEQFPALREALFTDEDVGLVLERFAIPVPPSHVMAEREVIDYCFAGDDVRNILSRLESRVVESAFAKRTLDVLLTRPPLSVAIALRQKQIGGSMSIEEAMRTEFRIVSRLCKHPDFYEGVRTTILERGQKPQWNPARVEDVRVSDVDAFFAPLDGGEL